MHVVTISVPQLGNRCHLVHDGSSALVDRPAAGPPGGRGGRRGGRRHDRRGRGHAPPQRLRLGRPRARGPAPCRLPAQCGGAGGRLAGRGARRRRGPGRRARVRVLDTPGHTRAPPVVPGARLRPGRPGRAVQRRQPPARDGRAGPTSSTGCSRGTWRRAQWHSARRLGRARRRHDRCTPRTASAASAPAAASGPDGDPTIAGQRRATRCSPRTAIPSSTTWSRAWARCRRTTDGWRRSTGAGREPTGPRPAAAHRRRDRRGTPSRRLGHRRAQRRGARRRAPCPAP